MNKSIFVLLFSLLLLIVTCVYQKVETIHQLKYPIMPPDNILEKPVKLDHHKVKEINTSVSIPKIIPLEVKIPKPPKVIEVNTSVISPTEVKQITKMTPLLKEVKVSVNKELASPNKIKITKEESKDIIHQAVMTISKSINTPLETSKEEKKELVEYLLSVLDERTLVLQERKKVMQELSKVITEALYNRRIAIENMNNIFIEMEVNQQRLIKERDLMYHSIPTPK